MNEPDADRAAIRRFLDAGRVPMRFDANPMAQALGATLLAVDELSGQARLAFEPAAHFVQGTGVLQGGAVAGMLDFAMALAMVSLLREGQACATVNLAASLMKPAPHGRYVALGEIERRGHTLAFARASLYTAEPECTLVATGTSVLALRA
ncbi:MAG TPA: PaaI family thioesterase [Burkholderiaceae bacterium]|nr:PaaI family thioesterase [Burkholderiaceae bacterium]